MVIEMTKEEIDLLDSADDEIAKYGKTDKKCPRCGNDIILEEGRSWYSIRCKTDNCISLDFRGF
ncbi:MAG: hypothetical protein LIO62_02915 [Clostridiales bacterium]|nr:hypothetical protein [Clostridiales bacterium]